MNRARAHAASSASSPAPGLTVGVGPEQPGLDDRDGLDELSGPATGDQDRAASAQLDGGPWSDSWGR